MAATNINEKITFNVGGKIFETRVTTILKEPNWVLTNMINMCNNDNDCRDSRNDNHNEVIFIDRDPTQFEIILRYLRLGNIDLNSVDLDLLAKEADFFGIISLLRLIDDHVINKAKEEQKQLLNKIMTRMEEYSSSPYLVALFCFYYKLIKPNLGFIRCNNPKIADYISGLLDTIGSYDMFVDDFLYCIVNWDKVEETDHITYFFDNYYQFHIRQQSNTEYFFDLKVIIKEKMYPFVLSL